MEKKSVLINILVVTLLMAVFLLEKYPERIYRKINGVIESRKTQYSFLDNEYYEEQTDFYTIYNSEKNIVMLGNSLTYRINWEELLERDDVANRGIGSDITSGYVNRLKTVLNLNAKICFIEGGVNDIAFNIDQDTIIKNLNSIIEILINHNVKPVLTCVTLVAKTYPDATNFNKKIEKLNQDIYKLARERKILIIDLNSDLSVNGFLKPQYAVKDGIHFTSKAYLFWKKSVQNILMNEKI